MLLQDVICVYHPWNELLRFGRRDVLPELNTALVGRRLGRAHHRLALGRCLQVSQVESVFVALLRLECYLVGAENLRRIVFQLGIVSTVSHPALSGHKTVLDDLVHVFAFQIGFGVYVQVQKSDLLAIDLRN